jgi:xylose dehydrogenase (NAD/NADP)
MDSVRWGLLSTARINRMLIPAIRKSRRGDLVAVASRDASRARQYSAEWDIPLAFGDYQEMLDSGEIDVVYIGLPNHLHAEWSIRALQAGVHVLCEKPFTLSVEDVDRMAAASRESGCVLAEAFMYRHNPQTKLLGEWVKSGRLGEVWLVRSIFNFILDDPDNIRMVPEWGGGSLWDIGVYPLSLAQYLYGGPPQWVAASQKVDESSVDLDFSGQLVYSGERVAQIACSFRAPFHTSAEILCTEGRLELNRPFNYIEQARMTFYPHKGDPQDVAFPQQDLYLGEVLDMHAAILDDVPPYITLSESRAHVQTVQALYQSAQEGRIVELS